MSLDDLCAEVLSHLHVNSAMRLDDIAATVGRSREDVDAAVEKLLAEGHLRAHRGFAEGSGQGKRLVPDAASHPTPGIYVANERRDQEPLEVDYDE